MLKRFFNKSKVVNEHLKSYAPNSVEKEAVSVTPTLYKVLSNLDWAVEKLLVSRH